MEAFFVRGRFEGRVGKEGDMLQVKSEQTANIILHLVDLLIHLTPSNSAFYLPKTCSQPRVTLLQVAPPLQVKSKSLRLYYAFGNNFFAIFLSLRFLFMFCFTVFCFVVVLSSKEKVGKVCVEN